MAVTVKDVARIAGVSTATVSRALRGFETVDPDIRNHVLEVAERLDYVGSPAAAALSTGRAGSIAIITPYVDRLAFQRMLSGVEKEMRDSRMDLLLYCTGDPSDPHPVPPHKRLARRVDGFLVLSLNAQSRDLEEILKLRMPVTMFGSHGPWTSSVDIDDRAGAATATQHLIDGGHHRIGLIYGREAESAAVLEHDRHLGFRDAMTRAGLSIDEEIVVPGDYTLAGGAHAMERLLAVDRPPSAVVCFSDEMAYGAIRVMKEHGVSPGADIAIIGYDGHDMSSLLDLSTISVPFEQIGATAARKLLNDIRGTQVENPDTTVFPTELVVRGTTMKHRGVS
ncbi:MAG: LacI family transcriptional regulator [Leifsonia xyli]|nr:MAG: LacI family transcriptional regulator [Leifsonia xyli]